MVYGEENYLHKFYMTHPISVLFSTNLFSFHRENQKNLLDSQFNAVPFEIRDDKFRVIVKSCSEAHYLHLPVIEDHFEPSDSNILGLLFGIHHKGFQFTEYLLRENDVVTGINQLVEIWYNI